MVISLPETYSSHPKMAVWKMKFHCGMAYLFSFREGKYSEHMTGFFLGAGVGHCGGVSFHSHRKRIFSSTWYCQSSFTSCSSISNRCLVLPGTQLARPNDVTQNGPWKRWRLLGLQYGHVWVFFWGVWFNPSWEQNTDEITSYFTTCQVPSFLLGGSC